MGTYTTNYNLFLPSIGEQGWGDLVNGNFTTIDNTMSGLNTCIETLKTETDAVEEKITALEAGEFETITANTINFSGTLSYSGYYTVNLACTSGSNNDYRQYTILTSPFPLHGVVSVKTSSTEKTYSLNILTNTGVTTHTLTTTQKEYDVSNAYNIWVTAYNKGVGSTDATITIGIPTFV